MKFNSALIVCSLVSLLAYFQTPALCSPDAATGLSISPELPNYLLNANTVCVVRVTKVQDLVSTQVYAGFRDSTTNAPVPTEAKKVVADVVLESVIKGGPEQNTFQVTFLKNGSTHPQFNMAGLFTELTAGEQELVFLEPTDDKGTFALALPASRGKSKISLGTVALKAPTESTPLRNVLSVLANGLADKSKATRLDCLQRIGSIESYLSLKADDPNDVVIINQLKRLNEPSGAELRNFVNRNVLPSVLRLTKDTDADVNEQAVYTAAKLQDPDMLPILAKMADKQSTPDIMGEAASIISEYKVPDAVKPLVLLLDSKNQHIRHQAAYSLRYLADPLAVPALLNHLDDSYPWAQYYIVTALFTSTDTPHLPGPTIFQAQGADYVAQWKKWAVDHADKVKALRAQFDAASPPKATH